MPYSHHETKASGNVRLALPYKVEDTRNLQDRLGVDREVSSKRKVEGERSTHIRGIARENKDSHYKNHRIGLLEWDHRLVDEREPGVRECRNDLEK